MFKNTTIKDIAKVCGCSATTVSRALKGSSTISKAMQEKIKKAAHDMGYIPNALAKSMRTGSTNTIAVCLQDFRNPFFSAAAKYIEQYLRSKNYFTLFATTNETPEQEYNVIKSLLSQNVDGILLFPIQHDLKAIELLNEQKMPYTVVGRYYDMIDTNFVVSDDEKGGYLITKHLISKNAKKILFLNVDTTISSARDRKKGYERALKEVGLQPYLYTLSMDYGKTKEFLIQLKDELSNYDAILLFCDIMGFEAYNTLLSMGYAVPKDILLASFDGLQQDIILPIELTSAATDRRLMAEKAVDLLLTTIQNKETRSASVHLVLDQYILQGHTT